MNEELVREISRLHDEPAWMLDTRLACWRSFEETRQKGYKHAFGVDYSLLDFRETLNWDELNGYLEDSVKTARVWQDLPQGVRTDFGKSGIDEKDLKNFRGVGAQYNSEMVFSDLAESLRARGVVYMSLHDAVRDKKYGEMVRKRFMTLVRRGDSGINALHGALWSGGSLVYVPRGLKINFPLLAYCRLNAENAGQFGHKIIVVDDDAELNFVEGCSSQKFDKFNLHAAGVEIFVGRRAKLHYFAIERWAHNLINISARCARVAEGGSIEWVTGGFGSWASIYYPKTILHKNATMKMTSVNLANSSWGYDYIPPFPGAVAGPRPRSGGFDCGAKIHFVGENAHALVQSKSIATNFATSVFRSWVTHSKRARNCSCTINCDSLSVGGSFVEAYPNYVIQEPSFEINHEATVGKIAKDKLDYLAARGIDEASAQELIVRGFLDDFIRQMPSDCMADIKKILQTEMRNG